MGDTAAPAVFAAGKGALAQAQAGDRANAASEQLKALAFAEIDRQNQIARAADQEIAVSRAAKFAFNGGGGGRVTDDTTRIAGEFGADLLALRTEFRQRRDQITRAGTTSALEIGFAAAEGGLQGLQFNQAAGIKSPFSKTGTIRKLFA